jgi:release factor glutamine methyltransferase
LLDAGWWLVEHGYDQGLAVRELFMQAGFVRVETLRDYGGNERVTLGQWVV